MKKILIILFLTINSSFLFAQTPLTIEGTVVDNSISDTWLGVNIPRNQPTTFTYRNNSITSVNAFGYMLQAGDEDRLGTNNNLNGEVITGNRFTWNGTYPTSITHGVFTGFNINAVLKYNYLENVPMGLIRKSNGMTNTSGGVGYNIVNKTQATGIVVKGMNGVNIYNNTLYSDEVFYGGSGVGTWRGLIDIYINTDITPNGSSRGTKIKNNIFYTKYQIYNIYVYEADCLNGFESDYNLFYCEAGDPIFNYLGSRKTFAQWQALGYDAHSIVVDPHFKDFTGFVPSARLDYGTDLGSSWQRGLSENAVWGTADPETTNQNGAWQVGARIYSSQRIPVTNIYVTGAGGASTITSDKGSLQLNATVLPSNATDKTVTWSISNGAGKAFISATGLVTAIDNGTVTAMATARDGSGITGTYNITISNQIVPVTSIIVSGAGGATIIAADKGSLQLSATVFPSSATNKTVTWSIVNGTGHATINATGLVTAIDNGTVTARATANDGSNVSGTLVITISNQIIHVTSISVTGAAGATSITTDKGSLQLNETILPGNATDKTVTWSIINGSGQATISQTGIVTAVENGVVTARATANDGSNVYGTLDITISNQIVQVTGITLNGAGGASTITTDNGTLQISAEVLPVNATDKTVTWSIVNGTGFATISTTGLVTAANNGTVTIRATSNDGSNVYGTLVITISNQIVPVTSINLIGSGGSTTITIDNGSLQLSAVVLPANATDKSVIWSLVNGTGQATINATGLVAAIDNGTVTARATANDGSEIFGTLVLTISNQIIPVTSISITGAGGATTITTDNGLLQLSETILPGNATVKTVTWSIFSGTGRAIISSSGLLTALDNGIVTVRATAYDGSGIFGSLDITISNQIIPVTSINVTGAGGTTIINTENGTLQLSAIVLPANATDKSVTWTLVNGTGQGTINTTGLLTAIANGTVTAIATANDASGVIGTLAVTINTSLIPVTAITVTGAGGISTITANHGSLQLSAVVSPVNATDITVTWTLVNGTGQAIINSTGLVTAVGNGTITARATANDGSGVFGILVITVSNQTVLVTGITVSGAGGASSITTDDGSLQLIATVLPSDAANNTVIWSIVNGTGQATINSGGLVTAVSNGTVTATATANDGSGVHGNMVVNLFNQIVHITNVSVSGAAGATTIAIDNGTLQLSASVLPANVTDNTVIWSIVNTTGQAIISATGLVTAVDNGTVTARATANDGSGIFGTLDINISNQLVPVTAITVRGAAGATTITTDNGSLQLSAELLPVNATDKTVTWSLVNGASLANISTAGLVTAVDNGTITVRATANDGSGVYGTLVITISNQVISVTDITVTGSGGRTTITNDNGTLQLFASVLPSNASNKAVTWSIVSGNGLASINSSGRVTAVDNGSVTARATARDGSGVYGTLVITISNQIIPVTAVTVTGAGSETTISIDNGSLQLNATVLPVNATDKTITWSIVNGTGQATINSNGLVTAVDNGTVTARATANDGSGVRGNLVLTISNQIVPVTGITVAGSGGATIITADNGSLQVNAVVLPANATNKTVTWSLINGNGQAVINSTGLVSAIDNGSVTAIATANDGSGIYASLVIDIFNQVIPVTGITVSGSGGASAITINNGTLQMSAAVLPANASNKTVTWTLVNGTGLAIINASGFVTAINNGAVTVRATANDGSGVFGDMVITISNQIGPATAITVTGAGGETSITTNNGSLQLAALIFPANAAVQTVSWSFVGVTDLAIINSTGLVSAIGNGTVTVRATANDGSGVYGTIVITISNQIIQVTGITVTGTGGTNFITTDNGTLQLSAAIFPANALDKSVTWSLVSGSGQATINNTGLVTAIDDGIVTAIATANDGSGVYDAMDIYISAQITPVTSINVTGSDGITTITDSNGSLQLIATVIPANATNNSVTWTLVRGKDLASIDTAGLVTAFDNGIVTVKATANDGSGIYGSIVIPIFVEDFELTSLTVTRDEIKINLNNNYISWRAGLYNIQGGLVISKIVNSDVLVFDISSLHSGLYIVVLSKGKNLRMAKVIKP